MRLALYLALVLAVAWGGQASAQQSCAIAGAAYADGAALCQPAVRDGRVEEMLFVCDGGAWKNTDAQCPDEYAYFCRIGPHAVPVGDTLLLGAGPAFLECAFPGVLKLNQDAAPVAPVATSGPPSLVVRSVQVFLGSEGAGLDCTVDACDGHADAKTLAAIAQYVRENFARLTEEERAAFGATDISTVEQVLIASSPIDVIPTFARIFDVPPAQ
jgi:hypothetical protein